MTSVFNFILIVSHQTLSLVTGTIRLPPRSGTPEFLLRRPDHRPSPAPTAAPTFKGRVTTAFLKRPSDPQSKIALDSRSVSASVFSKNRILQASRIADREQNFGIDTSMVAESKGTLLSNKRDKIHAASLSLQPRQRRAGEAIRELEWRIFHNLRVKQGEIQALWDNAYPPWVRVQALEVWAPFFIYVSLLFVAKLLDAPCSHELNILWISTAVFTLLGINNKDPDERTAKWVTYAVLTHFLLCWLPLQHPFVADQLLFHEKQGLFGANHANSCLVESFIPSTLQSKIMDLSKFLSKCSCETLGQ